MARVVLKNVTKTFGHILAVNHVDLEIADQQFVVLVGPSGCGKTTTLRLVAGLEELSEGEIRIGERTVNDVPPKDRNVAMVFQNYALYPHMTVYQNMSVGLRLRGHHNDEIERRVGEAAEMLHIGELLDRKPAQLSGGERQRVAMGRAIVRKPQVFLFDEPLSNLDAKLRVRMRAEIKHLHARVCTTVIYVTHDQVEAMTLADRIVVMNKGVIMQQGAPLEVYREPQNLFVAGFLGSPPMNFLKLRVARERGGIGLNADGLGLYLPPGRFRIAEELIGRELIVGIRPEHLSVVDRPGSECVEGFVDLLEQLGAQIAIHLNAGGQEMVALCDPERLPSRNERMRFWIDASKIHLFDPETELSIPEG
jgi:multiple sugar transport system ATP-binding protein